MYVQPGEMKTTGLADFFNVEELTTSKRLQELRSYGIDVHQQGRTEYVFQPRSITQNL